MEFLNFHTLVKQCVYSFVFVSACTVHMCFSSGKEERLMLITRSTVHKLHKVQSRDAPILPANFLENYIGKSKEQNAGKIGGKLEKMGTKEWQLGTFCMIKIEILK